MLRNPPSAAFLIVSALATLSLTACFTDSASGPDADTAQDAGVLIRSFAYHVEGNRIITDAYAKPEPYCDGDELILDTSTPDRPDTVEFSISGSTLYHFYPSFTSDSGGATLRQRLRFTRTSSGSGLVGSWVYADADYQILSGALSSGEKADLEDLMKRIRPTPALKKTTLVFTRDSVSRYEDSRTADLFINGWNTGYGEDTDLPDSALYEISVKALDGKTVELKGKKTGETVRIAIRENGDRVYTSSVAGHEEFRYLETPVACPQVYYPNWFLEFEQTNARVPAVPETASAFAPAPDPGI
jgi:hypothetical protein